jgi:hypothetical protein
MSLTTTLAPSRAKVRAIERPKPELAPVTMATFPSRRHPLVLEEVLGEPVDRCRPSDAEAVDVGVEVTAGQDHELLGLAGLLVAVDRDVGRREDVVGRGHHQQRRGADPRQIGTARTR